MLEFILIFVAAGCAAGFMAGLLGIGGGFVIVPVLVWVLPLTGMPTSQVPHFAIGTSLLCICVTAIFSARAHHRRQAVDWPLFKLMVPALIVGSLSGSALAAVLSGKWLIAIFVMGALATAFYLLSGHQSKGQVDESKWPYLGYSFFTGGVSALIGIGGGSVLVPYLVYKGKPIVKAVGTAAASGIPIALFGAAGYGIAGVNAELTTDYATGYLYWPAFLGIVIFSSLCAPLGVKLAHKLPPRRLRQAFAAFMFFTSGHILYSQWLKN